MGGVENVECIVAPSGGQVLRPENANALLEAINQAVKRSPASDACGPQEGGVPAEQQGFLWLGEEQDTERRARASSAAGSLVLSARLPSDDVGSWSGDRLVCMK